MGGGSEKGQKSVTYYLNGPYEYGDGEDDAEGRIKVLSMF